MTGNIFRSLFYVLTTSKHNQLARQIRYLKVENEILRSKLPGRLTVTRQERQRLLVMGVKLGKAIHSVVTIVKPAKFLCWIREEKRGFRQTDKPVRRGRERTDLAMCRLILKLARENGWGYTRIMGEIKKLRLKPPSRNTIKRILQEKGLDPSPKRSEASWDEFLKRHAKTMWQCDFLTKRIVTSTGIRFAFVFIWINLKTRKVTASPCTLSPNPHWAADQARKFVQQAEQMGHVVKRLQFDNDYTFRCEFREELKSLRIRRQVTPFRSPNLNAYVARFIQTLQAECLDHFIIFGQKHFDYLVKEFLNYYHEERPHQSLDNVPPNSERAGDGELDDEAIPISKIKCKQRLGGLLKSYSRAA